MAIRTLFIFWLTTFSIPSFSQRIIETVAGRGDFNFEKDENTPALLTAIGPFDIAVNKNGDIFFSDIGTFRVRKVDKITGRITTFAGTGKEGYSGDGGPALLATFNEPRGLVLDDAGNLYVSDYWNNRVRKIDAQTGIITTVAGNGTQGLPEIGKEATQTSIFNPNDIALDSRGDLYISALNAHCVVKVSKSTGRLRVVAGRLDESSNGPDGIPAVESPLIGAWSIAIDPDDNLYMALWSINKIKKVDKITGILTTVAGTGELGNSGDGGPALDAKLYGPQGIEVDGNGNLYISEAVNTFVNAKIRRINKQTGLISAIAGNGFKGFSGDGGPALRAQINGPGRFAFDSESNLFYADEYNGRIRKISFATPPSHPEIIVADTCLENGTSFEIRSSLPLIKAEFDFGDNSASSSIGPKTSTLIHHFPETGTYSVKAVVNTEEGRTEFETKVSIVDCVCHLSIPNVFTPNGDSYNDNFGVLSNCDFDFSQLIILNRWGQQIFSSNRIDLKWDGNCLGGQCSTGVYFFSLNYKFSGISLRTIKGNISLIR